MKTNEELENAKIELEQARFEMCEEEIEQAFKRGYRVGKKEARKQALEGVFAEAYLLMDKEGKVKITDLEAKLKEVEK